MKIVRFRTLDLLWVITLVGLALAANIVGMRFHVPRFLAGDVGAYITHDPPLWEKQRPGGAEERYAIRRFGEPPVAGAASATRLDWLTLSYDILLTVLAISLVWLGVRCFRPERLKFVRKDS